MNQRNPISLVPMESDLSCWPWPWQTPHFLEPHELAADLPYRDQWLVGQNQLPDYGDGLIGCGGDDEWLVSQGQLLLPPPEYSNSMIDSCSGAGGMYVPNEVEESLSLSGGLYSGGYADSSSPDGATSCSASAAAARAASKNIAMERDRRKRLNDKLYALRGVVPNITKLDKASIIRDAIAYVEQLQAEERKMLAEIAALESAAAAVKREAADPSRKKAKWAPSVLSVGEAGHALCPVAPPCPVEIHEVLVSEAGEKVAVVSVRHSKGRDAMAGVCHALESLRLLVVTASVTSVAGSVVHTMFVEKEGMSTAEMERAVHAALAHQLQLDVTRRIPNPMKF